MKKKYSRFCTVSRSSVKFNQICAINHVNELVEPKVRCPRILFHILKPENCPVKHFTHITIQCL